MDKSNENKQQPTGQPVHTPGPWEWDLRPERAAEKLAEQAIAKATGKAGGQ